MTEPLLVLEGVSLRLWRGARSLEVLSDVSLCLEHGELGGIWADRSAGKTTLLGLIAGTVRPDSGRVRVDGDDLAHGTGKGSRVTVHPAIGLADRRGPTMPDLPVAEWVAQTLLTSCEWREALEKARATLDRVGVGDVGAERWSHLADGERTLVAIAHAIARRPRLLLVDDLVVGLGAWRRERALGLLHELAADGLGVLIASTQVADLKAADRIWSLEDGRLIESAPREMAEVLPLRRAAGHP